MEQGFTTVRLEHELGTKVHSVCVLERNSVLTSNMFECHVFQRYSAERWQPELFRLTLLAALSFRNHSSMPNLYDPRRLDDAKLIRLGDHSWANFSSNRSTVCSGQFQHSIIIQTSQPHSLPLVNLGQSATTEAWRISVHHPCF